MVPVTQFTRHDAEESSDSSEDEDKLEGTDKGRSREKKIRKVDISNLLSTFEKQTRKRKQHFVPSKLFMVAMCVLARQCSRVFNVVTVNVVVSIIPNI